MRFVDRWIPLAVTNPVRVAGWINLAVNVVIVVTGGAVRLTASGLGCPTWPTCTEESLVTTPEMGIHGIIEFANRLLTVVLVVVALAVVVMVWRLRRTRPGVFWTAIAVALGIPAQAVIGGISVLVKLNPYVVGLHFIVSAALVSLCAVFVMLCYETWRSGGGAWMRVTGWVMAIAQVTTVIVGILTTGSGPHAGDAQAPRNGLNSEVLQHVHSVPAYTAFALVIILVMWAWIARARVTLIIAGTLAVVNVLQIVVGIAQSHWGLPPLLVATHMFLACVVVATVTALIVSLRPRTDGAN